MEFSSDQDMFQHARDTHIPQVSLNWKICVTCSKHFPDDKSLMKHKPENSCDSRNVNINKGILTKVLKTHVDQWCQCFCYKFTNCNQMYKHTRDVHPEMVSELWSKCEKCGETFPDKNIVEQHQLLPCKKLLTNICYYCHMEISVKEDTLKHAPMTQFEKALLSWKVCPTCVKHYPEQCRSRIVNIDIDNIDRIVDIDIDNIDNDKSEHLKQKASDSYNNCYFCDLEFSSDQDMFKHAHSSHITQISLTWKICLTCVKFFPDRKSLKRHQLLPCQSSDSYNNCNTIDIKEEKIELPDQDDVSDIDIKDEPIEWMVS
jgi:hypothetical protein